VTQEISDPSRVFRLLGSDRLEPDQIISVSLLPYIITVFPLILFVSWKHYSPFSLLPRNSACSLLFSLHTVDRNRDMWRKKANREITVYRLDLFL